MYVGMVGIGEVLVAGLLTALVGLVGVIYYTRAGSQLIRYMVPFSAGVLFAGALFHLYPESFESIGSASSWMVLLGYLLFFVLERVLHWRHCHEDSCPLHPSGEMIVLGNVIHNAIDGLIIGSLFITDPVLGWMVTLMVILHEIPQELGNMAVLLHSGTERRRAFLLTIAAQTFIPLAAIVGFFLAPESLIPYLMGIAAGGFLYISASDIIPSLHREREWKHVVFFLVGALVVGLIR